MRRIKIIGQSDDAPEFLGRAEALLNAAARVPRFSKEMAAVVDYLLNRPLKKSYKTAFQVVQKASEGVQSAPSSRPLGPNSLFYQLGGMALGWPVGTAPVWSGSMGFIFVYR